MYEVLLQVNFITGFRRGIPTRMNIILLLSILVACAIEAKAYDGLFFICSSVTAKEITLLLLKL